MRRKLQVLIVAAAIAAAFALLPGSAEAQRGGGRGAPPRGGGAVVRPPAGRPPGGATVVVRGGYYAYPYLGLGWGWGPYWGSYWYGPWGYPYPYWGPRYYDNSAELRLEVKPKQTQVYVDGYYAGVVDDFDGTFQRLRVKPGDHELVLYLEGYRTVRQHVRLGQRKQATIRFQMTPLAAGETAEPPPRPAAEPPAERYEDNPPVQPRRQAPRAPAPSGGVEAAIAPGEGYGSLVIRVQPSGSEVLIDGQRWQGPEGAERLVVQVPAGSHRVEVRKEGAIPFSTTIQVRAGETVPLNVSLPPRSE